MFKSFKQLHWSIYALALANGVIMTGFMMLLPLLPVYAEQLGFSEFDIGMLVAAFFIGRVLFQFPLGVLSDRVGRKGIMSGSLLLFTITTSAYALTSEPSMMMLLRLMQGVASSGFVVGSQSYVNDLTPMEFRGLANGITSSAVNIGVIAGPLLGGGLSQIYNMRTPFWIGGALGGLCFLLSLAIPRADPSLAEAQQPAMPLKKRLKGIMESVLCLPSLSLSAIHFLVMMSIAIMITTAPILTSRILGWGSTEIAVAFAVGGAAAVITSPFLGRLSDQAGRIRILALGLSALLLQGLFLLSSPGTALLMAAFALGGAGTPAYFNSFYSLIGDVTKPLERGGVTGFIGSFGEWGSIIGSSLIVPIAWSAISVRAPMAIDILILLFALAFTWMVRSYLQRQVGQSSRGQS